MHWRVLVLSMVVLAALTVRWRSEVRAADGLRDDETVTPFRLLTKGSAWELVGVVKMNFDTYHTQGLVKIGDTF